MRPRKCREKCPYCGKNDETKIASSTQFYCKRCKRYFVPNTERKEYSKEVSLVIQAIINLFTKRFHCMTIKTFVKRTLEHINFVVHNLHIIVNQIDCSGANPKDEEVVRVNGCLRNSIIITRSADKYIITKGLNVYQKIKFKDFCIHTRYR